MEKKRILSMLLPVAMLVTMIPVMTYAEEAGTDDGASAVSDVQEEQESVDIVSMYAAQDNLVAFFTVFKDGTVDIEKGTWTDLVGGGVATMGTPSRWFVNDNGSVGYDIFYGQVDGNGNYTKDSSYNNYSVNGARFIVFNTEIAYNYISDFMMSMEDGGVDISDITAVIAIAAGSSAE